MEASDNSGVLQVVAVKTEPKLEPGEGQAGQYSLADLDGITDLLPIQTGARVYCGEHQKRFISDFWKTSPIQISLLLGMC